MIGDKSITSWANYIGTKVLLGREYADYILFRGLFSLTSLKTQTRASRLKVASGGLVLRIFKSWKNPSTSVGFESSNLRSRGEHVTPRTPRPTIYIILTDYIYNTPPILLSALFISICIIPQRKLAYFNRGCFMCSKHSPKSTQQIIISYNKRSKLKSRWHTYCTTMSIFN